LKLLTRPDTPAERLALLFHLAPTPLMETQVALLSARAIMAATELGVFSSLLEAPLGSAEIATACHLHPEAIKSLLGALVSLDYLRFHRDRFHLTPKSRKWLAPRGGWSLFDYMPHLRDVWEFAGHLEDFLRGGVALDIHHGQSAGAWSRYQTAMRALASLSAPEVTERLKLPPTAKRMLDIGGAHGFYAVALCRRHPQLTATILELPDAISESASILAAEGMGGRVKHEPGDALTSDLGEGLYDLVLLSNLVHHFTESQNRDLAVRCARALVPGGILVIQDLIRPASPNSGDQAGQVLNLFFALTSTSGTWSVPEIQNWLRCAELTVQRPVYLRSVPGAAQLLGVRSPAKPAASASCSTRKAPSR
jgi:2-polyprenyl-3-methyl-5-hydroxy-6-metoxy-1,4-benzoquinol methylase